MSTKTYTRRVPEKTKSTDAPKQRKLIAFLSDAEWRALRVRAAENDTTIQGYVTQALLRDLDQRPKR